MTRWRARDDLSVTAVADEVFVVGPDGESIVHLDAMATALWRALAKPADRDEVLQVFAAAFPDIAAGDLARDLDRALAQLIENGLVIETPSP